MELIVFFILILLGYFFGRMAEARHYSTIRKREKQLLHLPVCNLRQISENDVQHAFLVSGSVVISVDYFKRVLAALRMLFGGRVSSYETLIDRGRREAILRMKEGAVRKGADSIYNIRIETASISKTADGGNVGAIEVIAYGTAIVIP